VLAAARAVNHAMNDLFGVLMRLTQGTALPGDSTATAQARISELWTSDLPLLRRRMRLDLDTAGTG
jgi:hypothetical protein